jgi:hypothetical protein
MNEFEMEFINDLKRLGLKRYEVADKLEMTMPTLKSKLKQPNKMTLRDVEVLQSLGFQLKNLFTN